MSTDVLDRKPPDDTLHLCWWLWAPGREAHFRAISDGIPSFISLVTPAGDVEIANRLMLDYFQVTREQVKQLALADTVHPDDRRAVAAAWTRATAAGRPYELEARRRRADGAYRWFCTNGLPLRDTRGRVVYWFVIDRDVDDRKRAEAEIASIAIARSQSEEALKRSEAFLMEAQRISATGSFSWRVATDEITWSDQVYRIFEFEVGTPLTLALIAGRVHPDDLPMLADMTDRARADAGDFEYEHRLQFPDGAVKYVHLVAHARRGEDGRLEYIGAVQDVSQRRQSEDALATLRAELAHVARVATVGALTASIAHEVNQPLSGIITNANTCLRMLAADPPNVDGARETARRTIRDGNRASEVIARLRALFGKKASSVEPVDLNDAAREVIALASSDLQRGRVVLRPELDDDLPPVTGDRVQLQQVILNLLRNAAEAMRDVDDRPRQIVIRTERDDGGGVRLTVQDTGVGFEAQGYDRLFDAFYTTKTDGMGIGLSVSRSIIEGHNGRLWAVPNDGPGATFAFSIPRRPWRWQAP